MNIDLLSLNWLAIVTCLIVGQIILTIWFAIIFAEPWAKAYGAKDKAQHTAEIPVYTYAIGAACVLALAIGIAIVQQAFAISTLGHGLLFGLFAAMFISIPTALPGYAFLKRWSAFRLAIGAQTVLIIIISVILALWP